jgi:hypothetical protein
MSAFLLALKLFAGNALSAVWRFLSHLKFWQAVCLGLLCVIVAQHFTLAGERRHAAKVEAQLAKSQAELQRITTARNEQKQTSERTVTQVLQGQDRVRTVVRTIHDAPNPPDCRTPELPEAARRVL